MALSDTERDRLAQLTAAWLPPAQLERLIGVNPQEPLVAAGLSRFAVVSRKEVVRGDTYSRSQVELWLQDAGLISVHDAALRLGMSRDSFLELAAQLKRFSVQFLQASDALASEKEVKTVHRHFRSLRGRIFSDHTDMCLRLHRAVQDELSISVDPVFCWVAAQIPGEKRLFSYYRCSVTDRPVSIKHAIPLDTGKSPRLLPDHVNRVTLYSGYDELTEFVLGSVPTRDQLRHQLGRV